MALRNGTPPGPVYWSPFLVGREMRRDPLAFIARLACEFGDVVCVRMGPIRLYLLFHPDDVKHVLQDNNQNYVKGPIIARAKVLIGEGLFTSEGSFWRRQRRLAQPAFHRDRIAGFIDTMVHCTAARVVSWEELAAREPLDVAAEMSALTLTTVGETLFGRDLSGEAAEAGSRCGTRSSSPRRARSATSSRRWRFRRRDTSRSGVPCASLTASCAR
jgi:cytochrome P450